MYRRKKIAVAQQEQQRLLALRRNKTLPLVWLEVTAKGEWLVGPARQCTLKVLQSFMGHPVTLAGQPPCQKCLLSQPLLMHPC